MNLSQRSSENMRSPQFKITNNSYVSTKKLKSSLTTRSFTNRNLETKYSSGNLQVSEINLSPKRLEDIEEFSYPQETSGKGPYPNSTIFDRLYKKQTKYCEEEIGDIGLQKMKQEFKQFKREHKTNDEHTRKFRMYDFINNKKKQSKVKYNESSKVNQYAIPVAQGTVSIMLNTKKKNFGLAINNPNKNKINKKSKFKIKWKTIQWVMNNKRDSINQLLNNIGSLFSKFGKGENRNYGLNRKEFNDLLSYAGLSGNQSLVDKMFFIFDELSQGVVDYREVLVSLEIFRDTSYDDKLKIFLDICDLANSGLLEERAIYDVFKIVCTNMEEKAKLRKFIRDISLMSNAQSNNEILKKEFYDCAKKHFQLKLLMIENMKIISRVDKTVENDLDEHFQSWTPLANNIVKYKEGIHFPLVNKLLKIFKDNEELVYQSKKRKQQYVDDPEKDNEDGEFSEDYDETDQK